MQKKYIIATKSLLKWVKTGEKCIIWEKPKPLYILHNEKQK